MCKRKTRLSLSKLRELQVLTDNVLSVNILDQFAEDLLLTFLNGSEAEPLDYYGNLLDCCHKNGQIVRYSSSDAINIINGKDFYLNYDFEINGTHTGQFNNLSIHFTKIEFNFLNNTWDMLSNSFVKQRLVTKMNEYEYYNMTLVEY